MDRTLYIGYVWNWISRDIISEESRIEFDSVFTPIVSNCWDSGIKTLDCAMYLVDKFLGAGKSSSVRLNFEETRLVPLMTYFTNTLEDRKYQLYIKSEDPEFVNLKTVQRYKTENSKKANIYIKVHKSILNRDFVVDCY